MGPSPGPSEPQRLRRRDTFLGAAEEYAAARPEYPADALEAAVSLAGLTVGDRVLEVGCGTGQATAWLAQQGFEVLAIDRSERMADLARVHLGRYRSVDVRCRAFEELPIPHPFAALVFATSYHWLDPADRVDRCAAALRPDGGLVLLWHTHPPPFVGFFDRVQPIYRRIFPGWEPPPSPGMIEERIRAVHDELGRGGRFEAPSRRSYDWSRSYDRDAYLRLLGTYSDHALLDEARRRALFERIGALIDREFDGRVERPYRTELLVARRSSR